MTVEEIWKFLDGIPDLPSGYNRAHVVACGDAMGAEFPARLAAHLAALPSDELMNFLAALTDGQAKIEQRSIKFAILNTRLGDEAAFQDAMGRLHAARKAAQAKP